MAAPIVFLMGPTAVGKTSLALELANYLPIEIISVDSTMVYQGMDIGTAKPSATELKAVPHHLIDILSPEQPFSAGQFRTICLTSIQAIHARGNIPLLVGGTMMYFRILQNGLADLPAGDNALRERLTKRVLGEGLPALHAELESIDKKASERIHPNDSQRIIRALEVYYATGKTLSSLQDQHTSPLADYAIHALALNTEDRSILHQRIAQRFDAMLAAGLIAEVQTLKQRFNLTADLPSMRAVNYRETWQLLEGELLPTEFKERTLATTRQLAKRQLTWLRSWPNVTTIMTDQPNYFTKVLLYLKSLEI